MLSVLLAAMRTLTQHSPTLQSCTLKRIEPADAGRADITRRRFLAGAGVAAVGFTILKPELVGGAEANSKVNIGVFGCGGRGSWIAELFAKNGNYNVVAIADYFQDRVDATGGKLQVPESKRFTTLSGYKRLLEEKLDAVAIETPPYFHPEQAAAAVDAGKHVYLAKPVAVDVPGCHSVADSARRATDKKLAFRVDFQTRAMPAYQEVLSRVHKGDIGKLITVYAEYQTNLMFEERDAQLRKDPHNSEVRLRSWGSDRVRECGSSSSERTRRTGAAIPGRLLGSLLSVVPLPGRSGGYVYSKAS